MYTSFLSFSFGIKKSLKLYCMNLSFTQTIILYFGNGYNIKNGKESKNCGDRL